VTTALKRLEERGVVSRDAARAFVLEPDRAREELTRELISRRPT
jgi:hypothetical protein